MASKIMREKLELSRWALLSAIGTNLSLAREIHDGGWVGTEARTPEARAKEAGHHLRFARRELARYEAVNHAVDMARAGKTDRQIWRFFATTSEVGWWDASTLTRHASMARERIKNGQTFELERVERARLTRGVKLELRTPRYLERAIRAGRIVGATGCRPQRRARVVELGESRHLTYTGLTPRQAVIAAYAQSRGDAQTHMYEQRYGHLAQIGRHGWHLDRFACPFTHNADDAHDWAERQNAFAEEETRHLLNG